MKNGRDGKTGKTSAEVLRWLPVGVLVLVAISHFTLVRSAELSPWKGAGFGMFSTTDGGRSRHFHVFALAADGRAELKIPAKLFDLMERTRELPTGNRMERLALAMTEYAPANARAIRVELWRTEFDPETMKPAARLRRAVELEIR